MPFPKMSLSKKSRLLVLITAALALLLGVYALLGFWALPKYLRSQAIEYVATELDKDLALGEIKFNPFTFQLEIRDIAIRDRGAAQAKPLVALKRLFADFQFSSLWKSGYVFRQVTLDEPFARAIIRPDGSLNLAELIPKEKEETPTPELVVEQFQVNRGRVDFADQSRRLKPEKTLAPIDFSLRDFRTTAESGNFTLAAASEQGERFDWQGKLTLQPLASTGQFRVAALKARSVYEFLSDELPLELSAGSFDVDGRYVFSVHKQTGTQLDATLSKAMATGLALRARGVAQDWVVLPKVALDNTRLSLARQTVTIDALRVEGMQATLWRERDGSLNLDRLLAPSPEVATVAAATSPSNSSPAAVSPDWKVSLGRLALQQGQLDFEDRSVQPAAKFKLSPLALTVDGISLDRARPLPITLRTALNGKAPLSLSGSVVPETVAADLQVELSGLPLREVIGYLPKYPTLTLKSGVVGAKGQLRMQPGQASGPSLSFNGDASVSAFDLVETAGARELISWDRVDAQAIAFAQGPDSVSIKQIKARKPFARVIVAPDQTINLVSILSAPADAAPAASAGKAATGMPVKIGRLLLENGVMGFADYSIQPNFQARIDALGGSIAGLSTANDSVADIDLKGQIINQYSPVTIQGGTNLFAYDKHTDIKLTFRNIDLPIFNPYSGRFAGYAIAKGKLTTELHYQIDDRKLQAAHHVILDQLEWGQATDSKDKVSLPVRLATSLLKDRHGVIDLNLPVTGTLDDPKFRVGPVVWQIIKNLLAKAVTAPFSFLGSLFAGAEDAQYVGFAPGSAELSESARTQLVALAKGLVDRPALKLEIPSGVVADLDPGAMAESRLQQALATQEKEKEAGVPLATMEAERQVELLSKLYKQVVGSKPDLPDPEAAAAEEEATRKEKRTQREQAQAAWLKTELLARYQATPVELEELGRARASAIQDALLTGGELDPARVFITANKSPVAHEGNVRLELGLE